MKQSSRKKPTMASIARDCGVSVMTVSRALRDDAAISDETRKRIREYANSIGYYGNSAIGRPRSSVEPRKTIDILLFSPVASKNFFHSELLFHIDRELGSRGYDCLVRSCADDYNAFVSFCESFRNSNSPGVMVQGYFPIEQLQSLLKIRPDILLVDHTGDPDLKLPHSSVGFDYFEAAQAAVRHLYDCGRRNPLLIKGREDHYFSRDIDLGFREALRKLPPPAGSGTILTADFSAEGARRIMHEAIDSGMKFDSVFTSDEMALGVLRALYETKRRVPGDISVCGCDGLPVGLTSIPRLTTMSLDLQELGRVAVDHLLSENRNVDSPCRIKLMPKLVIRESTRNA